MPKRILFLSLLMSLLAVGIAACQPVAEIVKTPSTLSAAPTATAIKARPSSTVTAAPKPTNTPVPAVTPTATPSAAPSATPSATQKGATPTVRPTRSSGEPTPTRPWQIPEVQSADWAKGGEDAGLVIVEYGDYQ